jgi:hypothetical protein
MTWPPEPVRESHLHYGVSLEFRTHDDAELARSRLTARGVTSLVRQGRIDGELADTLWWVSFDWVEWIEKETEWEDLWSKLQSQAVAVKQEMADLGCVDALPSLETGMPVDESEKAAWEVLPRGGVTVFVPGSIRESPVRRPDMRNK